MPLANDTFRAPYFSLRTLNNQEPTNLRPNQDLPSPHSQLTDSTSMMNDPNIPTMRLFSPGLLKNLNWDLESILKEQNTPVGLFHPNPIKELKTHLPEENNEAKSPPPEKQENTPEELHTKEETVIPDLEQDTNLPQPEEKHLPEETPLIHSSIPLSDKEVTTEKNLNNEQPTQIQRPADYEKTSQEPPIKKVDLHMPNDKTDKNVKKRNKKKKKKQEHKINSENKEQFCSNRQENSDQPKQENINDNETKEPTWFTEEDPPWTDHDEFFARQLAEDYSFPTECLENKTEGDFRPELTFNQWNYQRERTPIPIQMDTSQHRTPKALVTVEQTLLSYLTILLIGWMAQLVSTDTIYTYLIAALLTFMMWILGPTTCKHSRIALRNFSSWGEIAWGIIEQLHFSDEPKITPREYYNRQAEIANQVKGFRQQTELRSTIRAFQDQRKAQWVTDPKAAQFAKEEAVRNQEGLHPSCFHQDQVLKMDSEILPLTEDPNAKKKLLVQTLINSELRAIAQVDTGAQVSCIGPQLFERLKILGKLTHMRPEAVNLRGLNSVLSLDSTSPVILTVQIGQIVVKHRFIILPKLDDVDMLIGLDILWPHKLNITPDERGQLALSTINPKDPQSNLRARIIVADNINTLKLAQDLTIQPGTTQPVEVETRKLDFVSSNYLHSVPILLSDHPMNKNSPLKVPGEIISQAAQGRITVPLESRATQPLFYPKGWIVARGDLLQPDDLLINKKSIMSIGTKGELLPQTPDTELQDLQESWTEKPDELMDNPKTPAHASRGDVWDLPDVPEFSFTPNDTEPGLNEELFEPLGYDYPPKPLDETQSLLMNEDIPIRFRKPLVDFLRESCPNLISNTEWDLGDCKLVEHHIEFFMRKPLPAKPYRARHLRAEQLKRAIQELERIGILELGDSDTVSPVFFLPKKDGRIRLLTDYRHINQNSVQQNFPLGDINSLVAQVVGSRYFIALDLKAGYHCIHLDPESQKRAAIITPFGTYLTKRLTFGLAGAPATFSRCMFKLIDGLPKTIFYMDDLLIHGETEEELFETLKIVLKRLADHGMKIIPSKTAWFKQRLRWVGQIICSQGRRPDPDKVKVLTELPGFTSVKQVQVFLGHLNYQCQFIPDFSRLIGPITKLLRQKDPNKPFLTTPEAEAARAKAHDILARSTMLYHPDFNKPLYMACDASYDAGAGWIYQVAQYDDTPEDRKRAAQEWGVDTEVKSAPTSALPGASPGKQCPTGIPLGTIKNPETDQNRKQTADILNVTQISEEEKLSKDLADKPNEKMDPTVDSTPHPEGADPETKNESETKTQQLPKKVIIVKPIAFWSKMFSPPQASLWTSLEKETAAILQCCLNYHDFITACRDNCYLVSDAQAILWILKAKRCASNLKIMRWAMKLLELDLSLILSHCAGKKLATADFLSRLWIVPRPQNNFNPRGPVAIHCTPTFRPGEIITFSDIIKALDQNPNIVEQIKDNDELIDANSEEIQRNKRPLWEGWDQPLHCCSTTVKSMIEPPTLNIRSLGLDIEELSSALRDSEILRAQRKDPEITELTNKVLDDPIKYKKIYIYKGMLFRFRRGFPRDKDNSGQRVLPRTLVPTALALYHWRSHAGAERLLSDLSGSFFWHKMLEDCRIFSAGCVLCQEQKIHNRPIPPLGKPTENVFIPLSEWQIDICEGLPNKGGNTAFVTAVEVFSRYCVAFPISSKDSPHIADKLKTHVIDPFGPPKYISSDQGMNLHSKEMRKIMAFYGTTMAPKLRYAPYSHGLVEGFHKIILCLTRILAEQFNYPWTKVIGLATMLLNAQNRPQFGHRSSYELLFGFPPAWKNRDPIQLSKEHVLDPEDFINELNEKREFCKTAVEKFQKRRAERNQRLNSREVAMPEGTLVYLKRSASEKKKKARPRYFRAPSKVIKEYRQSVVHKTLGGLIQKDHKKNLKVCTPRTAEYFGSLPPKVKLLFGGEFTKETWDKHDQEQTLPDFLFEKDLPEEHVIERTRTNDDRLAGRLDPDEPFIGHDFELDPEMPEARPQDEEYDSDEEEYPLTGHEIIYDDETHEEEEELMDDIETDQTPEQPTPPETRSSKQKKLEQQKQEKEKYKQKLRKKKRVSFKT